MSEASIAAANAAVYYYDMDTKNWKSVDGGISRVDVYHNKAKGSYRVVAMAAANSQVVINSGLFKDLVYQKASETFHNWSDSQLGYGLNFASADDANKFASTMMECVEKLKKGGAKPTPAKPQKMSLADQLAAKKDLKKAQQPKKTAASGGNLMSELNKRQQSGADLEKVKEEIIQAMREEMQQMKAEILAALGH